jgi:hypothetical protein
MYHRQGAVLIEQGRAVDHPLLLRGLIFVNPTNTDRRFCSRWIIGPADALGDAPRLDMIPAFEPSLIVAFTEGRGELGICFAVT